MAEFFFVIKSLLFTVLVCYTLQISIGNETIEKKADRLIRATPITGYIKDVSAGGARAIQNSIDWGKRMISGFPENYSKSTKTESRKITVTPHFESAASKED